MENNNPQMKKIVLTALVGTLALGLNAQDFPGYRSGNYSGVNSVFFNPASIASSRFYIDVNLVSMSSMAANDKASFRLKNISRVFKGDSIRNQLFGDNAGPTSGMLSIDILGPSGMMAVGKKSAVAVTTRGRVFANVDDFDGKLYSQLQNASHQDPALPYTLSSQEDMKFSMNAWTEFGVSYATELINTGAHVLNAGVTIKYLAGAGNGYVNIDNFNGTINADPLLNLAYLQNTTGRIATGFGGMRVSGFEASDLLKLKSSGFGSDLGFTYEFRPDGDMQTVDGFKLDEDYQNTYRFKFGIAVLDLGSIAYKPDPDRTGSYDIDITSDERLYLRELNRIDVDDYKGYFDTRPQYFTAVPGTDLAEYNVSLPTTMQVFADLLIYDGWYVSLASQLSLSSNKTKLFNNKPYNSFTLTPRFEDKYIGVYLPVNYNTLTKVNAGLSFRIGPLFFGSGSLLTALMGDSRQADFHFGLRLGDPK